MIRGVRPRSRERDGPARHLHQRGSSAPKGFFGTVYGVRRNLVMRTCLVVLLALTISTATSSAQPVKEQCDRPGGCPDPIRKEDGSCVCPDKPGTTKAAGGFVKVWR